MKKIYIAAVLYMLAALASGMFARTFVEQMHHFDGETQLRILHTHLFSMGMMFMLGLLALEKVFAMSKNKWFNLGFWHYNAGFALTVFMMLVIGIEQVLGVTPPEWLAWISGLGHIVVTAGLFMLFYNLYERLKHEKDFR